MKKLFVLTSCFAVVLVMGTVSFAQESSFTQESDTALVYPELSVDDIIGEARTSAVPVPQAMPFGCPPYPMVNGYPAYGIPYSYPRGAMRAERKAQRPRRFLSRFAPPPPYPYPLPAPGFVPGMAPPPVAAAPAPAVFGQVPCQETLGAVPAVPAPMMEPNVFYRPTPIKNFMTLITAPRPYIGYDPYLGYPPFPGYVPPQ